MGSEQNRFPQPERRKKWGGCWGGLPCFGVQKSNKRIVPASRAPDNNTSANPSNGAQSSINQATSLPPHLLAPPSSPASFTNSALPSTAQSPSCHLSLSANSPGGPSNSMFATGPYAHETQLVTPPVFSTFTTEPSTAPLTPPPELAHLTTPSSPDVPFAQFLSSRKISYMGSYPYSPRSPASCLRSPVSSTPGDCGSPWDPSYSPKVSNYPKESSGLLAPNGAKSHDSNFFCPSTFAQFYLDQPHSVGRLSVSKDSDVNPNGGGVIQNKQIKSSKQDVEEVEAYRASFGFSADEMITTAQYVEISDVMDDSFTMNPCTSNKAHIEETALLGLGHGGSKSRKSGSNSSGEHYVKSGSDVNRLNFQRISSSLHSEDEKSGGNMSSQSTPRKVTLTDDEDIFSSMGKSRKNRKFHMNQSCSDAEIEYRRGRTLRECRGDLSWH